MIQLRFDQTQDEYYEQFVEEIACHTCKGKRLKPEVLAVTVGGMNIDQVCSMSVKEAIVFFDNLELNEVKTVIAKEILKEIKSRLRFLDTVGLDYLNLSRRAGTLSGGEAQRIRLATQIGSALIGVLYVLDEPSIGLHQRDNGRLIEALKNLRSMGNSVIVVEHDEETMLESDYIVDIGPERVFTAVKSLPQVPRRKLWKTGILSLEIIFPEERKFQFRRSAEKETEVFSPYTEQDKIICAE